MQRTYQSGFGCYRLELHYHLMIVDEVLMRRNRMFRNLLLVIVFALLQGCATPFAEFYHDQTGGVDLTASSAVILPIGEPQAFQGNDQTADVLKMYEDNYNMIGYSSFNSGEVDQDGAIEQAKKVHAAVVILYTKYTGSQSGVIPLTLPDTQVSTTSLSGNVYSTGGTASYTGNAYTTTYGTKTTYIPYTIHRSDYLATYWIKMKPPRFGVHITELPSELRQRISSNKGMMVEAVIKGSPAFDSDILRGDVIKKIGDIAIYDEDSFQRAINQYQGTRTDVLLHRGDSEISKPIQIRAGG